MSSTEAAATRPPRALQILGILAAIGLGVVWWSAAFVKSADPSAYVAEITEYDILPASLSVVQAYGFLVVELLLGAMLILGVWRRGAAAVSVALLLVFVGATAWAFSQGNITSCGCFGKSAARSPVQFFVQDALFILAGVAAFLWAPRSAAPSWRRALFVVLAPVLVALPFAGPHLPVDAWVTPVKPGADLSNFAVDGLRHPLNDGDVLLALLGPGCDLCDRSMEALDALATAKDVPGVVGVFAGGSRDKRTFILEHVPTYPVGHTPEKVMRQYYRKLPVFALLRDGVVQKAWWGSPPALEELRSLAAN